MSKGYSRLTFQKRIGIYYFLKHGMSLRGIAKELQVDAATVSREIQRNKSGKLYFPGTAQRKTRKRWYRKLCKLDKYPRLKQAVLSDLRK